MFFSHTMFKSIDKTLVTALAFACLFCVSCEQRDIHSYTAEEHFSAAQASKTSDEDLPLAIWHYEQSLADGTLDEATAAIAKIELSSCRDDYLLKSGFLSSTGAKNQDLETQLRLLKRRNAELESWISRLNTENLILRQSLTKVQEGNN